MNKRAPTKLFDAFQLGPFALSNRVVMAPLTRNRAQPPGMVPSLLAAEYYSQRASAGLTITEASQISRQGQGYQDTPGIYSKEQVSGWRRVADSVHAHGGRIFLQLWHVGRISHSSLQPGGGAPVAPSAIRAKAKTLINGKFIQTSKPRALELWEIPGLIEDFRRGAANALEAGFDGVEIHGANGYLLDQFAKDGTNKRTDFYGGSIENRASLILEVAKAVASEVGADRTGIRLSPLTPVADGSDSNPQPLFDHIVEQLDALKLVYIHVIEGATGGPRDIAPFDYESLRRRFKQAYIANNGYDFELATKTLGAGAADLISFGKPFISNPDLVERLKNSAPLSTWDAATFYGGAAEGYTDYLTLAGAAGERPALRHCGTLSTPASMQPRLLSNQGNGHSMDNPSRSPSASQEMLRMITGYWVSQIVRGAACYSLADHLERRPMTAREFAGAEGLDELATGRFLTACAGLGIVKLEGNRYFTTELLQTLRKGIPGSLSGFALSQAAPGHWLPWGRFTDALKTGKRQTLVTLEAEIWDYYETVPHEGAAFTEAMTNLTSTISDAVACLLDTTRFTQAVDVGGAAGAFLYSLMRANAALKGIVFDLPNVVPSASSAANEAGLAKRVRAVGGDFFESVPEGDLYLLKYILHDWGDAECLTILRNCRRAAKPGARLAVVEQLLEPGTGSPFTPLMDLNMLVMLTGRERTLEEYQGLFSDSGFGQISITRTRSPMMILTAEAV